MEELLLSYFPKYTVVSASLQAARLKQPCDPGNLSVAVHNLSRLTVTSSLLCLCEDLIMFSLGPLGEEEMLRLSLSLTSPLETWCALASLCGQQMSSAPSSAAGLIKSYRLESNCISLLPGKQPKGTLSIEQYSARLAFHLRKDSRRRCCFELICPGKRTYEVGTGKRRGAFVLVGHKAQEHVLPGTGHGLDLKGRGGCGSPDLGPW